MLLQIYIIEILRQLHHKIWGTSWIQIEPFKTKFICERGNRAHFFKLKNTKTSKEVLKV